MRIYFGWTIIYFLVFLSISWKGCHVFCTHFIWEVNDACLMLVDTILPSLSLFSFTFRTNWWGVYMLNIVVRVVHITNIWTWMQSWSWHYHIWLLFITHIRMDLWIRLQYEYIYFRPHWDTQIMKYKVICGNVSLKKRPLPPA